MKIKGLVFCISPTGDFFYLWYTMYVMKNFFKKWQIEILFTVCTLVIVVFGFTVGAIYILLFGQEPVPQFLQTQTKTLLPVVMILPHQDDEMFMVGKFLSFVERGHPVYVALATDGGNSHILGDLQKQGYKDLKRQSFAHARNLEFFDSIQTLGVLPDHIFFMNPGGIEASENPRYQDGHLTEASAEEIVQTLYDQIGDGIYMTTFGGHPDHVALARALQNFSGIQKKLFFPIERSEATQKFFLTSEEQEIKNKALAAYALWDPSKGRYAIGERSVDPLMKKWGQGEFEYYFDTLINL